MLSVEPLHLMSNPSQMTGHWIIASCVQEASEGILTLPVPFHLLQSFSLIVIVLLVQKQQNGKTKQSKWQCNRHCGDTQVQKNISTLLENAAWCCNHVQGTLALFLISALRVLLKFCVFKGHPTQGEGNRTNGGAGTKHT
jgi:hypothetical protein